MCECVINPQETANNLKKTIHFYFKMLYMKLLIVIAVNITNK